MTLYPTHTPINEIELPQQLSGHLHAARSDLVSGVIYTSSKTKYRDRFDILD